MKERKLTKPVRPSRLGIGEKIGRYTVIEPAEPYIHPQGYGLPKVRCRCECGNVRDVREDALIQGKTISCGCWNRDKMITHNMHGSRTYSMWNSMKIRCTYTYEGKENSYAGVEIYPEWVKSFESFYRDMGECPEGLSLHRLNNDIGYFPENCVWADLSVQNHVKGNWGLCSKGVSLKQNGKYEANIKKNKVNYYLGQFNTEPEAAKAYDDKSEELYGDRPNNTK